MIAVRERSFCSVAILALWAVGTTLTGAPKEMDQAALTQKLWPPSRIQEAIQAVEEQHKNGLLSDDVLPQERSPC